MSCVDLDQRRHGSAKFPSAEVRRIVALPVIRGMRIGALAPGTCPKGRLISLRHAIGDVHGWKMRPIWYVTYEVHKRGILPKRRSPRLTTTFETEAGAKDFARARLQEGLIVFAGTINPHVPRQLVSSHDIPAWLADEQEE